MTQYVASSGTTRPGQGRRAAGAVGDRLWATHNETGLDQDGRLLATTAGGDGDGYSDGDGDGDGAREWAVGRTRGNGDWLAARPVGVVEWVG
jgi:hypothetical protein